MRHSFDANGKSLQRFIADETHPIGPQRPAYFAFNMRHHRFHGLAKKQAAAFLISDGEAFIDQHTHQHAIGDRLGVHEHTVAIENHQRWGSG